MAILTFPSLVPDNQTFGIQTTTFVNVTSVGSFTQTIEIPGARWKGSMTFSDLTIADSITLKTFLLKLRGPAGRFYFNDLSQTAPQGAVTGTKTIQAGSDQRDIILNNTTNMTIGDYIQLGTGTTRELKMIVDKSGATLTVEPMIRAPIADLIGTNVTYSNPLGIFMLTSDDQSSWDIRGKSYLSTVSLDFIEAY